MCVHTTEGRPRSTACVVLFHRTSCSDNSPREHERKNIKEDGVNLFRDVVFSFNPVADWQKHADRRMSISFNPPWSHILRVLREQLWGISSRGVGSICSISTATPLVINRFKYLMFEQINLFKWTSKGTIVFALVALVLTLTRIKKIKLSPFWKRWQ